jgi:hypothetical protein
MFVISDHRQKYSMAPSVLWGSGGMEVQNYSEFRSVSASMSIVRFCYVVNVREKG